ncbi:hypothetical protein [Brevibacillus sp. 179-C9.3 HS]|uniref:hypothetical protein n=1 Tax=unclassified Brevibacillus TaxID=2684853 RepID=UPI00399F9DF5
MGDFLGNLVIFFLFGCIFIIIALISSFFVIEGIYLILNNTIFLGFLMILVSIGYTLFYFEGRRLAKKQLQRARQASAITAANRNHGVVSAATFALESK